MSLFRQNETLVSAGRMQKKNYVFMSLCLIKTQYYAKLRIPKPNQTYLR